MMFLKKFRFWLAGKIIGKTLVERTEDWRLVHVEELSTSFTDRMGKTHKGDVFFYFEESSLGRRRYEVRTNISEVSQDHLQKNHAHWNFYLRVIVPWLAGRFREEVPGYNDVPSLDVMAKLSMK